MDSFNFRNNDTSMNDFFLTVLSLFFNHVFLQSIFSYLGNVVDDVNNNRVQAMFSSPYRSQINVQLHDST